MFPFPSITPEKFDIGVHSPVKVIKTLSEESYTGEWLRSMDRSEYAYKNLLEFGRSPQEARGVLPIDLKTEIVMTCNLYEWKHIFNQRCSPQAHPQMQELMSPLMIAFREKFPAYFKEDVDKKVTLH